MTVEFTSCCHVSGGPIPYGSRPSSDALRACFTACCIAARRDHATDDGFHGTRRSRPGTAVLNNRDWLCNSFGHKPHFGITEFLSDFLQTTVALVKAQNSNTDPAPSIMSSAPTPPRDGDFTSEEAEALDKSDIFLGQPVNGKRTVDAATVNPPPSQGSVHASSSGSSSSTATVRREGFTSSTKTFEFPTSLESVAALQFIGFTIQASNEIFARSITRPDADINTDDLMDYAFTHIKSKDYDVDSPPIEAMTRMGLNQQIQDAITDPKFADVYGTETLHFWIKDTLRINYASLRRLNDRLTKVSCRPRNNSCRITA